MLAKCIAKTIKFFGFFGSKLRSEKKSRSRRNEETIFQNGASCIMQNYNYSQCVDHKEKPQTNI